jgi:hypothetical protein
MSLNMIAHQEDPTSGLHDLTYIINGESLPSENEQITESLDEEPPVPRPASEESSGEEPTQCFASPN